MSSSARSAANSQRTWWHLLVTAESAAGHWECEHCDTSWSVMAVRSGHYLQDPAGSSRFRWDITSGHPSHPGHSIPGFIAIATPVIHRCSTSPKGPNTCGQWRSVTLGQSSRIQQAQRPGQNHLHDQKLWSAASCALSRNWTQNPWLPNAYPVVIQLGHPTRQSQTSEVWAVRIQFAAVEASAKWSGVWKSVAWRSDTWINTNQ